MTSTNQALKGLIEERQKVWALAQSHIENLPSDEEREAHSETWQKFTDDLDARDKTIAEFRAIADRDAEIEAARESSERLAERQTEATPVALADENSDEAKLRQLLDGEVRSVDFTPERRDLTVGSATAGGNTVPTSFYATLKEHLVEVSAIRQLNVEVLTTASGEAIQVPKTTSHGSAALVGEGSAIPESDPAFGQLTLNAYKYATLVQVSNELISDTGVDLVGYIARAAGRAVGIDSGTDLVVGDGSSKPNGVITASTLGVTAAGVAAITADEVINLMFSVTSPYRSVGSFLIGDSALLAIRKLKDQNDQYLWQPALTGGEPNSILGRPYVSDPNVADLGTGNITMAYGDFSTYMIRDVGQMRVERSDDYAFNTDLVTWRVVLRTDGDLTDTTGAIKHLIQA